MLKQRLKNRFSWLAVMLIFAVISRETALAQTTKPMDADKNAVFLSRGEATEMTVRFFDLENKYADFLQQCWNNTDECLFPFSSRSNFSELRRDPVILYPDVYPAYRYYKSINIASLLDLARGYVDEEESPYKPERNISKIEALKLVLGAGGVVNWKDKFEFSINKADQEESQTWNAFGSWLGEQWWYGRYILSAVSKGIIKIDSFKADDMISRQEFEELLNNTKNIQTIDNAPVSSVDNYGQVNQEANTSANP